MFGECHAHIFMNGYDYRRAVQLHRNGPDEASVREHLRAYQRAGIRFVRDGGDRFGVSLLARELAQEYGIRYVTPGFALHKAGCYGSVVGTAFSNLREYAALVKKIKKLRGDFVKIMTTGILDFETDGHVTGEPLGRQEVFEMVHIAHSEGLRVMSHTNTAAAVIDAADAGADSIEHGNYQTAESIQAMREQGTVWVPTVVTVRNLIGCGRFRDELLQKIWRTQQKGLRMAWDAGVQMALGSDAGAFMVPHGAGLADEYRAFSAVLGESPELRAHLQRGEERISGWRMR